MKRISRPVPKATPAPKISANIYGTLVGKLNGPLSNADDNHVFIPVFVAKGSGQGVWRVAFNVESNSPPHAAQYYVLDERITAAVLPVAGFLAKTRLSYSELGLRGDNFKTITSGSLRTVVHSSVEHATLVEAHGVTFVGGLHDVHYNNGERPGSGHSNRPGQDGALAVYYQEASRQWVRRWIFIKFQSQAL